MLKPWKYNLIEQYFAAEISDEDLKKFQKLIKADPFFLQEVQKYASQAALLEDIIEENTPQDKSKQQLKALFQQATIPELSVKKLKPNRSSFFLRIAASLALLILFSWVIYITMYIQPIEDLSNLQEDSVDTPGSIEENTQEGLNTQPIDITDRDESASQESISQDTPDEISQEDTQQPTQIASVDSTYYYPNVSLENQMLAALNSRASSDLSQISPSNNQQLSKLINFKWIIDTASEVTLEVFNNQKNLVLEQDFDESTQEFIWDATAQADGLYYWRLLGEEDVLYIGRFYLNTNK